MTAQLRAAPLMDLVRRHAAGLADAGVASPMRDAVELAAHAVGATSAEVRTLRVDRVDRDRLDHLEALVRRRAQRVPLQHLTGSTGFRTLTLRCQPGVFIPRPETEILAGHAIDLAGPGTTVIEPCTGTGAVALSVAAEAPGTTVVATDRAPDAVELARCNARQAGLVVDIRRGDLLGPVDPSLRGHVDVLVSNPPYLTGDELRSCEPEVRDHDPHDALVAGRTGHEVTDRLIEAAGQWLRPGGTLLLEVAESRASDVARRARGAGLAQVAVVDDLAGRERIIRAVRPATTTEVDQ